VQILRTGLSLAALAGFLMFLAGDVKICDVGDGCGPGFPEWLYYGAGILFLAALVGLGLTAVVGLLRRRP
jgi:hypothetical protein